MALPYVTKDQVRKICKQLKGSSSSSIDVQLLKLLLPLHLEYGNPYEDEQEIGTGTTTCIKEYFSKYADNPELYGFFPNEDDGFLCPFLLDAPIENTTSMILCLARIQVTSENSYDVRFSPINNLGKIYTTVISIETDPETSVSHIYWENIELYN